MPPARTRRGAFFPGRRSWRAANLCLVREAVRVLNHDSTMRRASGRGATVAVMSEVTVEVGERSLAVTPTIPWEVSSLARRRRGSTRPRSDIRGGLTRTDVPFSLIGLPQAF